MTVAVLFAGIGMGHAAPQAGQPDHSPATAHTGHHGSSDAAAHQDSHCDGPAGQAADTGPTSSKHGAPHGCCASACFPNFTNPEITFVPGRSVTISAPTRTGPMP